MSSSEKKVLVSVTDIDEGTEFSYVLLPESLVDAFHDMAHEREQNVELLEVDELNTLEDCKEYLAYHPVDVARDEEEYGSEEEDSDDDIFGV